MSVAIYIIAKLQVGVSTTITQTVSPMQFASRQKLIVSAATMTEPFLSAQISRLMGC